MPEKNDKINSKVEEWALRWKTIETEVHDIRYKKEKDNLLMVLNNMKGYYPKDGNQLFAI